MKNIIFIILSCIIFIVPFELNAQKNKKNKVVEEPKPAVLSIKDLSMSGLTFRSIGPAVTGGRIIDIDVNPNDHSEYYAASGHGSLWKTENGGVTFNPVFDKQSSFSMGAVTLDPSNPKVVWVGTGENNAHSYVIPGDGVYKSEDGGKSWTNKGLKESQQIGEIVVHPTDPNTVWVAAYGPHRISGGDRGVYKTTDGGENWERVLFISEHTGVWELHMDPKNPDVLYAVAHQRQRKLHTIVSGGDESGIHKTTDGGKSWTRLKGGLPQENVGRIGMDISPANPDILYAVVDAKEGKGIYKSEDRGASWTKQSSYQTAYPFYMQKLFCDTENTDKIYAMDIFTQVSIDGGKSWTNLGEDKKHVDNHTLWIDPTDNRHLLSGCDGGVYESFDTGKTWDFKSNIPIAEAYKVTVDRSEPFYNVYIGTQDNLSLGGPSRTINSGGISNSDWYFTLGGDGFETQVDWKDPNIVYSQYQNGNLYRYDKKSGERLFIKSHELGDTSYRFDWDAALLISSHDNKRLYHAGNKVLRTDDRGNSWREISPDLTRGVPREMLDLMDRSWSIEEMIGKGSLAQIVTLAESPTNENILYAGSGDGLIHFTKDGGKNWQRSLTPGLPESARIHHIIASQHNPEIAYAACQDFFGGDLKPYLYKTTDGGISWLNINANLPERGVTFTIGEDHLDPNLLFCGTMFGVYVSNTEVPEWIKLSNGIPNAVTVMDLDIHKGENDLVVSTFGRGVYILDDYSSLRNLNHSLLDQEALLFPVADGEMFIAADPFGFPGVGFQGASYFTRPNPEIGAVFTYYIKEKPKSLKDLRIEKEKELQKAGKKVPYPVYDALKKEQDETDPFLLFTITDVQGKLIRNIKKSYAKGLQRIVWNFRHEAVTPVSLTVFDNSVPWNTEDKGYMVVPGKYIVTLSKVVDGTIMELCPAQTFECKPLNITSLPPEDLASLKAFNEKVADMAKAVYAADNHRQKLNDLMPYIEKAILTIQDQDNAILKSYYSIKTDLKEIGMLLNGDPLISRYEGSSRTSLKSKVDIITGELWSTTSGQTKTFERSYNEVAAGFDAILNKLRAVSKQVQSLEAKLETAGASATPGRVPGWRNE